MAELVLSAFLPVLFEKLMSRELLNFATQEGVRSKLKKWEKRLKMIYALLIDAEEKQLTNSAVKMWLKNLQDLAYDAEDILDEYATEALRRKLKIEENQGSTSSVRKLIAACCISCTPHALCSDFSMRNKIDGVSSRLQDLCKQRTELGLVEIARERSPASSSQRPTSTTSSLQTELVVYGRDEDKAKILEMVLADEPGDANFGVISIVGMGGLGKTTLAREIYNDEAMKEFDVKGWAYVSDDFDVLRISKAILESVTGTTSNLNVLDPVQKELQKRIDGRKFLLVLDDVWSTNYSKWETLRAPFVAGAKGSKIIVTTRHNDVASTMGSSKESCGLQLLTDEQCWSLFKKHACDNGDMGASLSNIIRQKVMDKCKGLPLAAKILGGLLRSKRDDDWLTMLDTNIGDLQGAEEIPTALKLSYYHLPSHLKRCYAYCAIFPKDYEFEKNELIFLWMAEGLIQQPRNNKQLEDLGGEYFHDLLSRSFFQASSKNNSKFIMHDLVNDLAQIVSTKICVRWEGTQVSNKQSKISKKTRYSSYICERYNVKSNFEVFNNAKKLRTHLSVGLGDYKNYYISNSVVSDILLKFERLRVLSLQGYRIIELPDSIGGLRLLRYLNLSYSKIRSLPESINSMCNLQILLLRNCRDLLKLPSNMGNLISLRHLNILGTSKIEEMPLGVRKWECLRTLSNFIVGKKSGSNLKDLENLQLLSGELNISKLENVTNFLDTENVILSDKEDLKVLLLEWEPRFDESRDEEVDKKVLDILQPHHNLEKLTIKCYGGTKFSTWVGDGLFSNMTVLKFVDCKNCRSLPSLGLLGSLKSLTIKGMKGIKIIGSEFYGEHCIYPFPSLETLCFEDLREWECWNPVKENESFSKLRQLSIVNCPKLSKRLPNNLSSLKNLVIRKCERLVVSLSSIRMLCKVELDKCKEIVCSSSTLFKSLESMTLSNILDCGDWSRQEFKEVQNLNIKGCRELIELWQDEISLHKPPKGLHSLISLKRLTFENCNTLTTLLEGIKQKNADVEELRIAGCDSLNFIFKGKFPQSLKKLIIVQCEKLHSLLDDNEDTCSTSLSSIITRFLKKFPFLTFFLAKERVNACPSQLEDLFIRKCPSLTCLPSIDQLSTTLTSLHIWNCSNLSTLSLTGELPVALKHLEVSKCSQIVTILPKGHLPQTLETLLISNCEKLESIVEKFHNNKALYHIFIFFCDNVKSLPVGVETLSSLGKLEVKFCKSFASFPEGRFPNSNLRIEVENCESFTSFPKEGFPNSNVNIDLKVRRCSKLEALPEDIHTLSSLQISNCPNLFFSGNGLPTKLTALSIEGLKQYKAVVGWGLHKLTSLKDLSISGWPDGESFQEDDFKITLPRSLTKLRIGKFPKLKCLSLKDFQDLPSFECLTFYDCPEITSLPSLPSSLLQLYIRKCPLLKEACRRDKGKEWSKIADIPCADIDGKLVYDPS